MAIPKIEQYGAKPAFVQWNVVRGDTATLQVEFYEKDESTAYDTDGWQYRATAYDPTGDILDDLEVILEDGYIIIKVSPSITVNWGSRYATLYQSFVSELKFDLQITIPDEDEDIVWTPIIGTISVLGDITPSGVL